MKHLVCFLICICSLNSFADKKILNAEISKNLYQSVEKAFDLGCDGTECKLKVEDLNCYEKTQQSVCGGTIAEENGNYVHHIMGSGARKLMQTLSGGIAEVYCDSDTKCQSARFNVECDSSSTCKIE